MNLKSLLQGMKDLIDAMPYMASCKRLRHTFQVRWSRCVENFFVDCRLFYNPEGHTNKIHGSGRGPIFVADLTLRKRHMSLFNQMRPKGPLSGPDQANQLPRKTNTVVRTRPY